MAPATNPGSLKLALLRHSTELSRPASASTKHKKCSAPSKGVVAFRATEEEAGGGDSSATPLSQATVLDRANKTKPKRRCKRRRKEEIFKRFLGEKGAVYARRCEGQAEYRVAMHCPSGRGDQEIAGAPASLRFKMATSLVPPSPPICS
jgi:hypothetical protein